MSKTREITELERDDQREIIKAEWLADLDLVGMGESLAYPADEDAHYVRDIRDMLQCAWGIKEHTIISDPAAILPALIKDQYLRYTKENREIELEKWEESEIENREMRAKGRG